MKILIITMDSNGGMIHYVSQMANSLSLKENVSVVVPLGIEKKYFTKNVNLIELKVGNIIKNVFINTLLFTRPLKFLKTIYKENPDIIHFNECHPWMMMFLPFLSRRFKIVTMIHDVNPHIGSKRIDQRIAKKIFIKFSDVLLVHGNFAKTQLKTRKKVYNIPHGDYSFFLDYTGKNKIDEEDNTILFFGQIKDYKGLNHLITAVNEISRYNPKVKLIIAGSGNFDKYHKLILNNKNFEVHNRFIEDEEVPIFFQRSKIVILPYIEGTQTGIIPIAYAFKKPVIITDVGSIPEVVDEGKTGLIIPYNDSKALENAIVILLNDNDLRIKMGENAYNKMKKELSWEKISDKLIEIYKKTEFKP